MAFISEPVSQEDIEKYGLAELHEHYTKLADPHGYYEGMYDGHPWIVDRDKNAWMMLVGIGCISDDIPPMATGRDYYILHYKGKDIEVLMRENRKEGSRKFSDDPFRIRWEILSIKPESFEDTGVQEIVDIITEAFVARGYDGIKKFVSSFDVKVKYLGGQK